MVIIHQNDNNSSNGVTRAAQWWDSWQVVDALSKCLLCHAHTMPLFFIFLKIVPHILFPVFHISQNWKILFLNVWSLSRSHYATVFQLVPRILFPLFHTSQNSSMIWWYDHYDGDYCDYDDDYVTGR